MIPCPIQLKLINSTLKSGLKNEQGEGSVVKSLSKGGISFKKEGESTKKKATFHKAQVHNHDRRTERFRSRRDKEIEGTP